MTVSTKAKEKAKKYKKPGYDLFDDFKGALLEHMGHEDFFIKLVSSLHNRKDADHLFFTSIFKNKWTWLILASSSLIISTFVFHFPSLTSHVLEKAVNSQVPDMIPPLSAQKPSK